MRTLTACRRDPSKQTRSRPACRTPPLLLDTAPHERQHHHHAPARPEASSGPCCLTRRSASAGDLHKDLASSNHRSDLEDAVQIREIDILTKELASCKLQLEVKENENKQANLKLEALQKAMQELSDKYDRACLDAHNRIAEIETDNSMITRQQSETADECMALKDELAIVKGELDTVKGSNAFVLKEVELMETRMILERENTKGALMRILQLNEAVLSSAVAAIRAEEERSVFFQEITLEFFNSDKKLELIKRQVEMIESLEKELLAKTVEIDYFQSELKQVKELYISPQEVSDATADDAAGCTNINDQVCETTVEDQKPQAEVAFQHSPETCFVTETSRKDCQVVTSDDTDTEGKMSEDVIGDTEGAEVMVLDSTMLVKNFDAQEACFVNKISQEDDKIIDSNEAENKAGDQEPEADATVPNSTACKCVSEHADVCLASEIPREAYEVTRSDDKDEAENHEPRGELTVADNTTCHGNPEAADTYFDAEQPGKDHQNTQPDDRNTTSTMPENVLEVHEEPKAEGCFVAESSVEDFQSVHSDKDMDITMPENVAGNQEPQAEATAPNSTPCKGNSEAAGNCFVTEIVTEISKDDDEEAFYTKEIGQANKLDEGYVLVTKKTDDSGALKDKLDAAHTEISDLRFSLEEAVRRAELAEEAKAALERELREEIQRKQRPRRRAPLEDVRRAREATQATPPARLRPTPSWTPGMPRSAGRGDERPWPGCLTLGKVLNMKYK